MNILNIFKNLFVNEDHFTYSSNLDESSVEKILTSKNFPIHKKIVITKEQFEIFIRSSTSVVPPRVTGKIFRFNNGTKINLEISQNKKLKILFYLIYGFILGITALIISMLLFGVGTFTHENIEEFLLIFSLILLSSIGIPKILYIYERNKAMKLLSRTLKLSPIISLP
jgi:hypothetical protein